MRVLHDYLFAVFQIDRMRHVILSGKHIKPVVRQSGLQDKPTCGVGLHGCAQAVGKRRGGIKAYPLSILGIDGATNHDFGRSR
ncbi:hypothetical protein [Segatella baroniae]|uniref:hypothetical protein n=1 Tax=Segatella baroniae TaxID=305719 RepID=UPI0004714A6D|nr:hypothetical protein [Segatella baroniae]